MTPDNDQPANFFKEGKLDPIQAATGVRPLSVAKKKAGFYLPVDMLDRFNRKFFELKLAGCPVENKSALVEAVLKYALDDLDRGTDSQVLKTLDS
jgi:hypothetical protein